MDEVIRLTFVCPSEYLDSVYVNLPHHRAAVGGARAGFSPWVFFSSQISSVHAACLAFDDVIRLSPGLPTSRNTPSPIDPDSIQVPVGYEPDPADLALSSVPGQEMFDPRKRKFSAEELKPQPMIKKARKVFIPEDLKVIWSRL